MRRLQIAMLVFVACAIIFDREAWGELPKRDSRRADRYPSFTAAGSPLPAVKKRTKWGTNWQAPSNRLSVDTLNFGLDRTLGEVHATLSNIKGRRITVNALDQQRFVLEGTDSDGTFFHVSGAERMVPFAYCRSYFPNALHPRWCGRSSIFYPVSRNSTRSPNCFGAGSSKPAARFAEPAICHLADNAGSVRATSIDVRVKRGAGQILTGDPITVEWKATSGINLGCRTPHSTWCSQHQCGHGLKARTSWCFLRTLGAVPNNIWQRSHAHLCAAALGYWTKSRASYR